jgi:hypothetical protein
MSFVIALNVREGIVMASDSRLTLDQTIAGSPSTIQLAVSQSDSSYKAFLAPTGIGILTFGAASIGGEPLAGFIESFINEVAVPKSLNVAPSCGEFLRRRVHVWFSRRPASLECIRVCEPSCPFKHRRSSWRCMGRRG